MGIHDGHRERMKARFLEYGLDNFDDIQILEMLLFYSIPMGDVNPTAHALLNHFGSLAAVFDAPFDELVKVRGVGRNSATLIKLIPQIDRRYMISKNAFDNILNSTETLGRYIMPRFHGETDEVVYLICLDAKLRVLSCKIVGRGSVKSTGFSVRKIVETALACNASCAVLAHNHTSGIALPSREDAVATKMLYDALLSVDIRLIDHIIVAGDDFVSMADSGYIKDGEEV